VIWDHKESIDQLLKRFRRKVQFDQILKEVKNRTYFMTRREKLAKKKKLR
jgi:ribosomal protein S21